MKIQLTVLAVLLPLSVFAAPSEVSKSAAIQSKGSKKSAKKLTAASPELNFPGETLDPDPSHPMRELTSAEVKAETDAALERAKGKRALASGSEAEMSKEMLALRDQIVSLKSGSDLNDKLELLAKRYENIDAADARNGVTKDYDKDDRDFRFFAAQILPLRCLKGIAFRFLPLAEKSSIVDSRLASAMFQIAQDVQILSPGALDIDDSTERAREQTSNQRNPSRALFEYITEPYEGAILFERAYELQAHLYNQCRAALLLSANRIERLSLKKPIVLDRKMYFGVGSFPDKLNDRFRVLGEAERHLALADKALGIHFISFFRSYTLTGYFQLQRDLAQLNVEDAFSSLLRVKRDDHLAVSGVSQRKRRDVILAHPNLFLKYNGAQKYMDESFTSLARAVQEIGNVWTEFNSPSSDFNGQPFLPLLNSAFFRAANRPIDPTADAWNPTLDAWKRLTQHGPADLHSRLTGSVVKLDLYGFYHAAPFDLKKLLPTDFESASDATVSTKVKTLVYNDQHQLVAAPASYSKYRNYFHGGAVSWDREIYGQIFPGLHDGKDLPKYVRTVSEAWGGTFQISPIIPFLR